MSRINNEMFKALAEHINRRASRRIKRRLKKHEQSKLFVKHRKKIEEALKEFYSKIDIILEEFIDEDINF